jgi:protein TonB
MFEDSTFESAGRIRTRSRRWIFAAFTFYASILVAMVLIPLICPEALQRPRDSILITVPPAPAAQPRPQPVKETPRLPSEMPNGHILAPPRILPDIYRPSKPEPDVAYADPGWNTGPGVPGSIGPAIPSQPKPRVRQEPTGPVPVSTGTAEGLLISRRTPVYPHIAIAAHMEGTVILAATISKAGTIENLRVVSGPSLLQQAAVDAVSTWRYRPYLLDGQPVEVETTVNVVFTLGR